ncbi:hypothetical protein FD755_015136 [Muntiacus reevesi]|uniref:Vasculin-like protein 1 n=1 Tax=Muntiacus reevesi TaxID=9886 RepID=A0A5N3XK73_MUNRE|nr:hypothetical protein FD755_015136 [Muntiacus reevesi]
MTVLKPYLSTCFNFASPTATFEKHGEHLPRGDGIFGVSYSWHQPSLFHHDSVDSGVSKGAYAGITGSLSGWHGSSQGHDGMSQHNGHGTGNHHHWNGSFHSQKGCAFQEKPPTDIREEKKEDKVEKLQFEEEDFPSLNPEAGKQNQPCRPIGTPSGSPKKFPKKILLLPSLLHSPGSHHANGNKLSAMVPRVYKNLVPKPIPPPSKDPFPLAKSLLLPVQSVIKPLVLAGGVVLSSPKGGPTSTTPPIEISSSRLTKLTRQTTDRKSEFLKTLKDDRNGDFSEGRECAKLEDSEDNSTSEPKENGEEGCHQNCLALPVEEEHRLLKAIGWQEYPENDKNFLPLTEDELRENGFGKNDFLQSRSSNLFSSWRSTCRAELEDSDAETSSSETSDNNAWE